MKRIVNHIKNLRSAPHHVKRRWLWGLTALAMVLLISVWLINLQKFLKIPPPQTAHSSIN